MWEHVLERVGKLRDGMGKGVDDGIRETVVALNVLGIHTIQSCEGHIDHGIAAPWVDVGATEHRTKKLEQRVEHMRQEADEQQKKEGLTTDVDRRYEAYHRLREKLAGIHMRVAMKAARYLIEFYQGRSTDWERRIVIDGFEDGGRIISQGGMLQEAFPVSERRRRRAEYQEEMGAFTAFLKQKFFESGRS